MKILSLKFESHPILGDMSFNFTKPTGEVYETVILMGENGCGKTTILDIMSSLFNYSTEFYKTTFSTEIQLSEMDVAKIIDRMQKNGYNADALRKIETDLSKGNIKIERVRNEKEQQILKNLKASTALDAHTLLANLQQICTSVYSSVDINFNPNQITTVTAQDLDISPTSPIKSSGNLATEIKQLFIDITTEDSLSLSQWVNENPGLVPPDAEKNKRLNRFKKAFNMMFVGTLNFSRVSNKDNKKEVFFNKNGTEITLDDLSSGEKQIIFRGAFLLRNKDSITGAAALIDEPEISMHPKWQKNILNFYKKLFQDTTGKQTSQIFIASHSEHMFTNKTDSDAIFIMKKDSSGMMKAELYESKILPYESFAEVKYLAFGLPTIEYFNELYGYIEYKKGKVDNFISQENSNIATAHSSMTNKHQWAKMNGASIPCTFLTCVRHKIHHRDNTLNDQTIFNGADIGDTYLKQSIDFMLYLINNFGI